LHALINALSNCLLLESTFSVIAALDAHPIMEIESIAKAKNFTKYNVNLLILRTDGNPVYHTLPIEE